MNRDLEERRQRADAAWRLIQADVVRLREAVRDEVTHLRTLGPRSVVETFPLSFAGMALGVGFALGFRGGRRGATLERILEHGPIVSASPARSTLGRRIVEAIVLAAVQRGAAALTRPTPQGAPAREEPEESWHSPLKSGGV
jgi:hypothetical protein